METKEKDMALGEVLEAVKGELKSERYRYYIDHKKEMDAEVMTYFSGVGGYREDLDKWIKELIKEEKTGVFKELANLVISKVMPVLKVSLIETESAPENVRKELMEILDPKTIVGIFGEVFSEEEIKAMEEFLRNGMVFPEDDDKSYLIGCYYRKVKDLFTGFIFEWCSSINKISHRMEMRLKKASEDEKENPIEVTESVKERVSNITKD